MCKQENCQGCIEKANKVCRSWVRVEHLEWKERGKFASRTSKGVRCTQYRENECVNCEFWYDIMVQSLCSNPGSGRKCESYSESTCELCHTNAHK